MKTLGRSDNGGHIVEMTQSEYVSFTQLERALSGSEESDWHRSLDYRLNGTELSRALLIIREWTEGHFLINSLQNHINRLKEQYLNHVD